MIGAVIACKYGSVNDPLGVAIVVAGVVSLLCRDVTFDDRNLGHEDAQYGRSHSRSRNRSH
ncbi:uncharacterized protein N7477_001604 [Penicillium maclennaniae]|uniref:uncharacterized protein n=1 Tax=Penicillium maclennaniae TaxID=1343394 RepID=UPI00253FEC55|nr:uncharacterized protein N7477_001604 [Penicillium maclennaniae]KAJ5681664.1 hypothetical protein N7477_001604 [Penicillium maclennaniae]